MRIITLIENVVNSPKLVAEHGLSLYIETTDKKILFDTGQSGLFLQNALTLGISIEDIDCLVLSHGHYDHTGGLYPFFEKNSNAKVYVKHNIFVPKYSGKTRFIGTLYNDELLKNRLVSVDSVTEIAENIFIMPDTPIHHSADTNFKGFYRKADQEFVPDEFDDELFMVIRLDDKINILTACSHRGITNICTTATNHFKLPIGLILGGFHMKECSVEQYVHITHYFRMLQPESIGSCHCTGIDKFAEMRSECETHMFYNYTGNEITV
jgi:7,8-dihydropterin-6-yl-methyl-4-(beta-D-ribofuranosyl)aminobenzene 5'-phosphate synthase